MRTAPTSCARRPTAWASRTTRWTTSTTTPTWRFRAGVAELGADHCPYGQVWRTYYEQYPWFRRFAPLYCDVIDTTVAENLTRTVSHRITENVLTGAQACRRVYFDAPNVSQGWFTYGTRADQEDDQA